jgi:hypothetical protein
VKVVRSQTGANICVSLVTLADLSKYESSPQDDSVIAWPIEHTKPNLRYGKKKITFTIEALALQELEDHRSVRLAWEAVHRAAARQERKHVRKERETVGKEMNSEGTGGSHDEL